MPVGVPCVDVSPPEEEEEEWSDLYAELYEDRVLFLGESLEDELTNQLMFSLMFLSIDEPDEEIFFYINSPGGSITCGMALYDTFRTIDAPVSTICVGTASSMASLLLAGGEYGKRIALPHSRIMIHQPEGGNEGQADEVLSESEEVLRIRQEIGTLYARRTGQSLMQIARDMDRDQFMSAREAKEYGLVDYVIVHDFYSTEVW